MMPLLNWTQRNHSILLIAEKYANIIHILENNSKTTKAAQYRKQYQVSIVESGEKIDQTLSKQWWSSDHKETGHGGRKKFRKIYVTNVWTRRWTNCSQFWRCIMRLYLWYIMIRFIRPGSYYDLQKILPNLPRKKEKSQKRGCPQTNDI